MKFKRVDSVDSEFNSLSQEQIKYFANSQIRDADGNLLVCYHGDKRSNKDTFRFPEDAPPCTFFSTDATYASGYGDNIYKCYLNITKPFGKMNGRISMDDRRFFKEKVIPYGESLKNGNYNMVKTGFTERDYPIGGYLSYLAADLLYCYLKRFGGPYDGIIANENPDSHKYNYGSGMVSFIPLNKNQIKLVSNKTPKNTGFITEGLLMEESEELSDKQKKFFRLSKIRTTKGDLLKCYIDRISPDNIDEVSWLSTDSSFGRIEVYLNCTTPFVVNNVNNNLFIINSNDVKLSGEFKNILRTLDISEKLFVKLLKDDLLKPGISKYSINDVLNLPSFSNLIKRAGYDCIKIVERDNDKYGVFANNVIKLTSNKEPTNNIDPSK